MKRYVWFNIDTGEFSNSWTDNDMVELKIDLNQLVEDAQENTRWKLISYECLSHDDFQFYDLMKIVTNGKT